MRTVDWDKGVVRLIDQRKLPWELTIAEYRDYDTLAAAISQMVVRGAPAIGATAAYGMALAGLNSKAETLNARCRWWGTPSGRRPTRSAQR